MRVTYPDACYLSGCVLPIRMRVTYPDARYLSGCVLPIRMRVTYPEVRNLSGCALPIRMRVRCDVTNVVKPPRFSREISAPCYKRRQSAGENARKSQFQARIDDVCNKER